MTTETPSFADFALGDDLQKSLTDVGYETPSPIQSATIPLLLDRRDIIGQAQTGTGKTAAFALPLLANLDLAQKTPQILVLAPTRELAIQVAEAFKKYAKYVQGFRVLPVYGGQDYRIQTRALERGVHVVVGTPGRVMDHMRRKTMKLDKLKALVLDEADEMLRMGFIDDVEWVLEQTPDTRQIALFSATMPTQIRRIATRYLNNPEQVTIKNKTATTDTIRQRYWPVSGLHKLDALTRILEAETYDGVLIFARTKNATVELAEKLQARGYNAEAINGDIPQKLRERTIAQLKSGKLDLLVATDVAARGLDVDRISHVINYDIPHDTESYVHRIGRTGRAGRKGDAILFVAPRERRMLQSIERATRQKIEVMELPSTEIINDSRVARFKQNITDTLANDDLKFFTQIVEQYEQEHNIPALEIAAALAHLAQGDTPLLLQHKPIRKAKDFNERGSNRSSDRGGNRKGQSRNTEDRPHQRRQQGQRNDHFPSDTRRSKRPPRGESSPDEGLERFRIEVGHNNEVQPGNIVGAIAGETGIDAQYIGRINIQDDHSTVDLPKDMPKEIFHQLKKVWVAGTQLNISKEGEGKSGGEGNDAPSRSPNHKQGNNRGDKRDSNQTNKRDQRPSKPHSKAPSEDSEDGHKPFTKRKPKKTAAQKKAKLRKREKMNKGKRKKPNDGNDPS